MYFIRRLIFAVPLLLVISALAFALVHLAPGGPFDRERAPGFAGNRTEFEGGLSSGRAGLETISALLRPGLGKGRGRPLASCARQLQHFLQIPQPPRQRHHRPGAAGFHDARRAGVWFRHGRSACRWDSSPRRGAGVGRIMPAVFWRCWPFACRALSSRRC